MMQERKYYVYIVSNKRNGTLYVGVTNSIFHRDLQHKFKENKNSFTAEHDINKLVYYEIYSNINAAIQREKQLKKWRREWKIALIKKTILFGKICRMTWSNEHKLLDPGSRSGVTNKSGPGWQIRNYLPTELSEEL